MQVFYHLEGEFVHCTCDMMNIIKCIKCFANDITLTEQCGQKNLKDSTPLTHLTCMHVRCYAISYTEYTLHVYQINSDKHIYERQKDNMQKWVWNTFGHIV